MKIVIVLFIFMVLLASWPLERFQPSPHQSYYAALLRENLQASAHRWLREAQHSLQNPVSIALPYSERQLMENEHLYATTFEFERRAEQLIQVDIISSLNTRAEVFVDVFEVDDEGEAKRIASMPADKQTLTASVAHDSIYRVRVQPSHTALGVIDLVIRSPFRYGFPVDTPNQCAVQSFFGAARDSGARRHEGIDIFAPRGTPVIAAADGRVARVGDTPRGGKNVWVQGDGRSFYYAHLDSIAVRAGQQVTRGQHLGGVGNTGNAVTTSPHLHFGIYRRLHGAVDPLPLVGRTKIRAIHTPADVELAPRWLAVDADRLNLRTGPSQNFMPVGSLTRDDLIRVNAIAGDWLRVTSGDGHSGYVLRRLTRLPSGTMGGLPATYQVALRPQKDAALMADSIVGNTLQSLGRFGDFTLVKLPGGVYGWASEANQTSETSETSKANDEARF